MNAQSLILSLLSILIISKADARKNGNPYQLNTMYVTNNFTDNIRRTMSKLPNASPNVLKTILKAPTAFWLSHRIPETDPSDPTNTNSLLGTLTHAAKHSPAPIVTIVVYNLPNRDCGSGASMGEICCLKYPDGTCNFEDSRDCKGGLAEYRHSYIDVIAETVKKFCDTVPMAFVIEPDSLPNLVTNLDNPRCNSTGTVSAYRQGIKYTVQKLHETCSKSSLYLDAAHGRWLGWDANAEGYAKEVAKLGIWKKLRGFSVNVANYNQLGIKCPKLGFCNEGKHADHPCCKIDPCGMAAAGNPGLTELNYVEQLRSKFKAEIPKFKPHFVIDTSRNSVRNALTYCSTWCNPRNTGMGVLPTVRTASPSVVDAYLWIKIPGETDGCTERLPNGQKCPRFVEACARPQSFGSKAGESRVPEAGQWFFTQIETLARKASFKPQ